MAGVFSIVRLKSWSSFLFFNLATAGLERWRASTAHRTAGLLTADTRSDRKLSPKIRRPPTHARTRLQPKSPATNVVFALFSQQQQSLVHKKRNRSKQQHCHRRQQQHQLSCLPASGSGRANILALTLLLFFYAANWLQSGILAASRVNKLVRERKEEFHHFRVYRFWLDFLRKIRESKSLIKSLIDCQLVGVDPSGWQPVLNILPTVCSFVPSFLVHILTFGPGMCVGLAVCGRTGGRTDGCRSLRTALDVWVICLF